MELESDDLAATIAAQPVNDLKQVAAKVPQTDAGRRQRSTAANAAAEKIVSAYEAGAAAPDQGEVEEVVQTLTFVEAYEGAEKVLVVAADRYEGDSKTWAEGMLRRVRLMTRGEKLELSGTTTDGKPFKIDDYAGKVVLIDFWGSFCGPCLREMPVVKNFYNRYHKKGFEVVGVSHGDEPANFKQACQSQALPWVNLSETENASERYAISGIPRMFLIGKDGKARSIDAAGDYALSKLLKQEFGE